MPSPYSQFSTRKTPQSEPIPGKQMVENSAGGYSFALDKWEMAKRFLILGSEGGTYYISQRKLTKDNATSLIACIEEDGERFVELVATISESGRAPKNDPAIFGLALASAMGNEATRRAAFNALPRVCRIGTHLFHFAGFREQFAGWGRGAKRAVASWYEDMPIDKLAYQAVKYRQRDGWSHRDMLRLSHPKADSLDRDEIFAFLVNGGNIVNQEIIAAYREAQKSESPTHTATIIRRSNLPREAVKTEHLNSPEVWQALLDVGMPMTALVRNLGNLSKVGILVPFSDAIQQVVANLLNEEALRKSRIHPMQILLALSTYSAGHGVKGGGSWTPVAQVVDALNEAFYMSFGNVEKTGLNTFIGLDVSSSMSQKIMNTHLSCCEAATAMALVTAHVEYENYGICAFNQGLEILPITPKMRMDSAMKYTKNRNWGGTDCALPMLAATQEKWDVDTFIVYTDNETWAGHIHPSQALVEYRAASGRDAKLVVVGMTSNGFTIADPSDSGMLDVVGFDAATPQVISNFAVGL